MNDTVLLHVADGIATITLNRPAQLNALNADMMQALRLTSERVAGDASIAVVIVKGAGAHFMAGGDIKEFHSQLYLDPPDRLATFKATIEQWINPTVLALRGMHQPVIASIRGACAGFGLSLALCCDLLLAAEDAYFTTAYSHIALSPDGAQSYILPRVVGAKKAAELLLLGERIDAQHALRLRLVNRLVPPADLDAETLGLARRLTGGPRHAYGEIKRLLESAGCSTLEQHLKAEADAFARCSATEDFAEGIRAFVEKRKPGFRGS
jgi:2-(1,2-epoxy-1,2-dihydrophenyl)acetyl-CoA isomerase